MSCCCRDEFKCFPTKKEGNRGTVSAAGGSSVALLRSDESWIDFFFNFLLFCFGVVFFMHFDVSPTSACLRSYPVSSGAAVKPSPVRELKCCSGS